MEQSKLIKSSKIIDKILKILQGCLIAGMIVAAIFIPLIWIFGSKMFSDLSTMRIGEIGMKFSTEAVANLDFNLVKVSTSMTLASAIVVAAFSWYSLRLLRQILAPMKEGRPFVEGISTRIRKLAWAVLIGGAVAEAVHAVGDYFEVRLSNAMALLENPAARQISFEGEMNFWFVGCALLLFFMSYVFRYGETLQRESDETL